MASKPIVIEFSGIPYSQKTSTIKELGRLLEKNRVGVSYIDEYPNRANEFYQNTKLSPDINLVRLCHCLENIIIKSNERNIDVILIDRGIYDSLAWLKWFDKKIENSAQLIETILKLTPNYSSKYRVVWMDGDPQMSLSHLGAGSVGRITNYRTLTQLKSCYEDAFYDAERFRPYLTVSRIEAPVESRVGEIALKLAYQLKLLMP